jgi:hypothetical protein
VAVKSEKEKEVDKLLSGLKRVLDSRRNRSL